MGARPLIVAWDVTGREPLLAWRGGETVQLRTFPGRKASQVMLTALTELEQETGSRITHVGFVSGPGSFTGIRAGLATAQGLRLSGRATTSACTAFDLCALRLGPERSGILLPGSQGYGFSAVYEHGQRVGEAQALRLDQVPHDVVWLCPTRPAGLPEAVVTKELGQPVVLLYPEWVQRQQPDADAGLEPFYVRPPDVRKGVPLIEQLLKG